MFICTCYVVLVADLLVEKSGASGFVLSGKFVFMNWEVIITTSEQDEDLQQNLNAIHNYFTFSRIGG